MTTPAKRKGDAAELEAARLLADLTGWPVRRKLGAGRSDDCGDLDGVPESCVQVKSYKDITRAINECLTELPAQQTNAGTPYAFGLVRRPAGRWFAVLDLNNLCALLREATYPDLPPETYHDELGDDVPYTGPPLMFLGMARQSPPTRTHRGTMRRDQLPLVTLDGRHAGELLAHPCACGRQRCTLGDHIWQATRDMTPGPRAQSFDPSTVSYGGTLVDTDTITVTDPTATIDARYERLVQAYWDAARDLACELDRLRPDRRIPLPEPASDDQWCRHHLETIGTCEPRHRGDLCRSCYDLQLAHGHLPDGDLMRVRHHRGYLTDRDITEWRARLPKPGKHKRKKAS